MIMRKSDDDDIENDDDDENGNDKGLKDDEEWLHNHPVSIKNNKIPPLHFITFFFIFLNKE